MDIFSKIVINIKPMIIMVQLHVQCFIAFINCAGYNRQKWLGFCSRREEERRRRALERSLEEDWSSEEGGSFVFKA